MEVYNGTILGDTDAQPSAKELLGIALDTGGLSNADYIYSKVSALYAGAQLPSFQSPSGRDVKSVVFVSKSTSGPYGAFHMPESQTDFDRIVVDSLNVSGSYSGAARPTAVIGRQYLSTAFFASQIVESFQMLTGKADPGKTDSEAVGRVVTFKLTPELALIPGFNSSVTQQWWQDGHPDFASVNSQNDQSIDGNAAGVMFLEFLTDYLGVPMDRILQHMPSRHGAPLGEMYVSLFEDYPDLAQVAGADGPLAFQEMVSLLEQHTLSPDGGLTLPPNGNPFPNMPNSKQGGLFSAQISRRRGTLARDVQAVLHRMLRRLLSHGADDSLRGRAYTPRSRLGSRLRILVDGPPKPPLLDFDKYRAALVEVILNSEPRFTMGIFGDWGTGKTTLMRLMKESLDSENILTVWFNAWRYEQEKTLAVVPLLRTIRLAMEKSDLRDRRALDKLKNAVQETLNSLATATTTSVGPYSIDVGKMIRSARSYGLFRPDADTLYYDGLEYLGSALREPRKYNSDFRLVIFVDDLDRCAPDRALEILESLKGFLDIEGIIYVIGINGRIIDALVKSKYGETLGAETTSYMKKLVQVPFQIPSWSPEDLRTFINESRITSLFTQLDNFSPFDSGKRRQQEDETQLIRKSVELNPNPREVKRFVNSLVIAEAIFEKPVEKLPIEELTIVQALRFTPSWEWFYDKVMDDKMEKRFLKECKNFSTDYDQKVDNGKWQFPSFLERLRQDTALRSFLSDGVIDKLLKIDDPEKFRRAIETALPTPEKGSPVREFVYGPPLPRSLSANLKKRVDTYRAPQYDESLQQKFWPHVYNQLPGTGPNTDRLQVITGTNQAPLAVQLAGTITSARLEPSGNLRISFQPDDPNFPTNQSAGESPLELEIIYAGPVKQADAKQAEVGYTNPFDISHLIPGTHVQIAGPLVFARAHGQPTSDGNNVKTGLQIHPLVLVKLLEK